jgi:hypothetical protein
MGNFPPQKTPVLLVGCSALQLDISKILVGTRQKEYIFFSVKLQARHLGARDHQSLFRM